MLNCVFFFLESLPVIIIMSAVIGGIILTMFAIIVMLMCRKWQFQAKAGFSQEKTYAASSSTMTTASSKPMSSVQTATGTSSSIGGLGHTTATTSDPGSSTGGSDVKSGPLGGINGFGATLQSDWEQDSLDESVTHPIHHGNGPRIVNGLGGYGMVSLKILFPREYFPANFSHFTSLLLYTIEIETFWT